MQGGPRVVTACCVEPARGPIALVLRLISGVPGLAVVNGGLTSSWLGVGGGGRCMPPRAPARSVIARYDGIGSPVAGVGKKLDS
jgi:hypothetical protein